MTIWTHFPFSLILHSHISHFLSKGIRHSWSRRRRHQNLYSLPFTLQSELSSQFWRMKEAKYRDLIIESEKRKLSSQTLLLLLLQHLCRSSQIGVTILYSVLILKKSFVNNQKTFQRNTSFLRPTKRQSKSSIGSWASSKRIVILSFREEWGECRIWFHIERDTRTVSQTSHCSFLLQAGVTIPIY